jgi:hypothetical protein
MVTCGTSDACEGLSTVRKCVFDAHANKKLHSFTVNEYIEPGHRYCGVTPITIGSGEVDIYCGESRRA